MYGADWIKYYSDRKYHFEPDGVLHSMVNFTDEEAQAIVDETHRLGKKVAAHAIGSDGIAAALRAGVDTIEHGDGLTEPLMSRPRRATASSCKLAMSPVPSSSTAEPTCLKSFASIRFTVS